MEAREVRSFSKVSLRAVQNTPAQFSNERAAAARWSPGFPTEVFCVTSIHISLVIAILSMLALFIVCYKTLCEIIE